MQEQQQEFIVTAAVSVNKPSINLKVAVEILIALLILIAIVLCLILFGAPLLHAAPRCSNLLDCIGTA